MEAFIKDKRIAKMLLNNPNLGVIFVNEKDIVEYCNEEARNNLYDGEDITGRRVEECHPPHLQKMVAEILDNYRKGKQEEIEAMVDTGKFHVKNVYTPVFDAESIYRGMVVTISK